MNSIHRRDFLKQTAQVAGTAAVAATLPQSAWAAPAGANERIRVAVMGLRGRGKAHTAALLALKDVDIPFVCDVDTRVAGPVVEQIEKARGKAPTLVPDIRQILADKSIDAITIATTNHWHVLAAVWACQAGKDVYVEKPISQTVVEGRRLIEAAQKYGRIVQHGTQNRSNPSIREAIDFIRAGKLGKVTLARAINFKARKSIGKHSGTVPIAASVDYDLWLGPAPKKPLERKNLHYDWHWFWDYGSGDMGNQGVHQIDLARWALNKELPKSVVSVGGRFLYDDDGETANTQLAVYDYGDCRLICEVRNLPSKPVEGVLTGDIFYGTEGYIVRNNHTGNTCQAFMGKNKERIQFGEAKQDQGALDRLHFANFVGAMRSRKSGDLHASAVEGHYSSSLCHLANISHRLGTETPFEPTSRVFVDREPTELFQAMVEHLRENGLKLDAAKFRLGRKLLVNGTNETLGNDREANALLTRTYRTPFVVPDKV